MELLTYKLVITLIGRKIATSARPGAGLAYLWWQ
jgi:hypothetical protein